MSAPIAAPAALANTDVVQALADARWLIVNYGWRQHTAGNTSVGFSADGAILAATGHDRELHAAAHHAFQRAIDGFEIGPWNDVYGRTRAQVVSTFYAAEALARQGVAR
jgi:hypothetical protein